MTDTYVVAVEGLDAVEDLEKLPRQIAVAASRAINSTARTGRTASAREMRRQVNFGARYLSGAEGRLELTKFANTGNLEAVITGRDRPTSLARFARKKPIRGKMSRAGVRVEVKPGSARVIKRAHLIRLRAGDGSGPNANLGLALRTARGQKPSAAYKPVKISEGLWLLYGPSVDQVFRSVSEDVAPELADRLETEFLRLMDL